MTEANTSAAGAETNLAPNIQFISGESFSYDAIYNNGSGNHASQPLINGNYPPTQLETCNFPIAGCGVIGWWNDAPDLGAEKGTYHITYEFSSNQIKMTAIRPDNVTIINTFTGNSEPFTLAINTHTGDVNGLINMDYDNFVLCTQQNETTQPTLEDRVTALENEVGNLTARVTMLETIIDKIKGYFWFMPYAMKKDILCGSLKDASGKNITEWNVNCEMKKQNKNNICVCKKV